MGPRQYVHPDLFFDTMFSYDANGKSTPGEEHAFPTMLNVLGYKVGVLREVEVNGDYTLKSTWFPRDQKNADEYSRAMIDVRNKFTIEIIKFKNGIDVHVK